MRFPTVEYMQWAKTIPEDAVQIGASGVPLALLPDLGLPELESVSMLQDGLYGSNPAREAIGAHYGVPPAEIYPTEGTSLANFVALAALLDGGGHAVVETPVYTPFLQQVEALADQIDFVERRFEDGFDLDPAALAQALRPETKVVALTNLHNPSGTRLTDGRIAELAAAAAQVGAHLLIDEVYRDFLYDEEPGSSRGLAPNILTTASLTKVYGLGNLRFGWLMGPEAIVHRASRINDYLGVLPPSPGISLGLRAMEHLPELKARSRAIVEGTFPVLREWLSGRDELEVVWPAGGPILFPRLTSAAANVDTDVLARTLLDQTRVSVVPGRFFREPRGLRLGATSQPEMIRPALEHLGEALQRACGS